MGNQIKLNEYPIETSKWPNETPLKLTKNTIIEFSNEKCKNCIEIENQIVYM